MIKIFIRTIIFIILSSAVFGGTPLLGADYYVATNGNDNNPGTFDQPWASWQKGFEEAQPGDMVYIRGGIYRIPDNRPVATAVVYASRINQTTTDYISVVNYPGETPILDCYDVSRSICDGIYFQNAKYWHLKGLTIKNVLQNTLGTKVATGFQFKDCDYIIVENCVAHNIEGAGFKSLNGVGHYTYINCDSYNNFDPYTALPNVPGGNADGFCAYDLDLGSLVVYKGCRAWGNSDDGFDTYWTDGLVTYDECWSFGNGYYGGNGFKLGPLHMDVSYETARIVRNCIASNNGVVGFAQNFLGLKLELYNNSAYYNRNDGFDMEAGTCVKILKNNLAYANYTKDGDMGVNDIHDHNSWDVPIPVSADDFVSLDTMQLYQEREVDGSLPEINFMKLAPGSKLIDAGIDVGLNFKGIAPDIGAFESNDATNARKPVLKSASVLNENPSEVLLEYDLNLVSTIIPSTGSFAVRMNSVINPVYYVDISGNKVHLSITRPVKHTDTILVTYLQPAINPMQTAEGGLAETFMLNPVTNSIKKTIPDLVGAVIENATPSTLILTYDLVLANVLPSVSSFAVTINSVERSVNALAIYDSNVILTLAGSVVYNDVITVSYTSPEINPLQSDSGGQAESIADSPVTNNVEIELPVNVHSPKVNNLNHPIILIYPNPATSFINLSILGEKMVKPIYIRIINQSSNIVFEDRLISEKNELQIPINLVPGVYFVQMRSGDSTWYNQKMVVQ